jgi:hypothetical protein
MAFDFPGNNSLDGQNTYQSPNPSAATSLAKKTFSPAKPSSTMS